MKSAITGPWSYYDKYGPANIVEGDKGNATISGTPLICQLSSQAHRSAEENTAIANLIVAAPDLLDACQLAYRLLSGTSPVVDTRLQQAISKALGTKIEIRNASHE